MSRPQNATSTASCCSTSRRPELEPGAADACARLFARAKAGHTGSLDPLATGLLPICFGEATKIAGYLLGSRKAYETECRLGVDDDTDDAEGEVVVDAAGAGLDDATIEAALARAARPHHADAAGVLGDQAGRRARCTRRAARRRRSRCRRAKSRCIDFELRRTRCRPAAPACRMRLRHLRAQPRARPRRSAGLRRASSTRCAGSGSSRSRADDALRSTSLTGARRSGAWRRSTRSCCRSRRGAGRAVRSDSCVAATADATRLRQGQLVARCRRCRRRAACIAARRRAARPCALVRKRRATVALRSPARLQRLCSAVREH